MGVTEFNAHIKALLSQTEFLLADRDAAFREFATWPDRFGHVGIDHLAAQLATARLDAEVELLLTFLGFAADCSGGLNEGLLRLVLAIPSDSMRSRSMRDERYRCLALSPSYFYDIADDIVDIVNYEYLSTSQSLDMQSAREAATRKINHIRSCWGALNSKVIVPEVVVHKFAAEPTLRSTNVCDRWGSRIPLLLINTAVRAFDLIYHRNDSSFVITDSYYVPQSDFRFIELFIYTTWARHGDSLILAQARPEVVC